MKVIHLPTLTAIFFSGLRREGHSDGFFINVSRSRPSIYSRTTCKDIMKIKLINLIFRKFSPFQSIYYISMKDIDLINHKALR